MSSAGVSDPSSEDRSEQKRQIAFLLLAVFVAAAVRIAVAYHGGIWADEGFFLRVVDAPSWGAMLDFLRFHESHPPLFYAMMRVWMRAFGSSDTMALVLPVAIGIAIVPAVYVCCRRVFSIRTAVLAATLAVFSPALVEFSTQLRPYGLLPLLVLVSSWALVEALATGNTRHWVEYVISTLLMVYTHNWTWLVVFGQIVAILSLPLGTRGRWRPGLWREALMSGSAVIIGYLPWAMTLFFQMRHAGHPPLVVQGLPHAWQLAAFALPSAFAMVLFGTLSNAGVAMVLTALVLAIAAAVVVRAREDFNHRSANHDSPSTSNGSATMSGIGRRVFLVVPTATVVGVVALSSRTNLLLPRCLAMLAPLLLLAFADWIDRQGLLESAGRKSPLAGALITAVVTISIIADVSLVQTTRSNVREVASVMTRSVMASDLVIVIPEWYAASFGHYFPSSVERIDYPHAGKSGMVDFSDVFARVADREPLDRLNLRIHDASVAGRRVWIVTGRPYVRPVNSSDSAEAFRDRQSPVVSALRVREIRTALAREFGSPDTSAFIKARRPRYDEILPYLYLPRPRDSVSLGKSTGIR